MAASGAPMPQGAGLDLSSPPLRVALLGSANLVRGSMNLPVWLDLLPYDELNVCVSEPRFCASLDASMNELWADADELDSNAQLLSGEEWAELHEAVRYSKWRAEWEELWQ
jgi:phosphatidylserine/phosphatidylglycerophosphate/cardiolipin synthase-like enzyme